jgi:hypothetical protein
MKRINALLAVIGVLSGMVLHFEDEGAERGGVVTGDRHDDDKPTGEQHSGSELASEGAENAEQDESGTDNSENEPEGSQNAENEHSRGGPSGDTE